MSNLIVGDRVKLLDFNYAKPFGARGVVIEEFNELKAVQFEDNVQVIAHGYHNSGKLEVWINEIHLEKACDQTD